MTAILAGFVTLRAILRVVFLWAAVIMAVIAVVDWLVRTRRLNPFGPVARAFRKYVDPLLAPVEQRVVRAGGLPAYAPLWALGGIVVAGIVVLALLDFAAGLLADLSHGFNAGPRGIVALLVYWTFAILRLAIIVRVLASWLPLSPHSRWVRWAFTLSEPIIRPLRRWVPVWRSIDLSPFAAFVLLLILESLFRSVLG